MPVFESFIYVDKLQERCASLVLGSKSLKCMDLKGHQIISVHFCVWMVTYCQLAEAVRGLLFCVFRFGVLFVDGYRN